MFRDPSINIISKDVTRLASFYMRLGFRETYRTPEEGKPAYMEVTLDRFTIGISSVEDAISDHGLKPNLAGHPVEIVLWNDDTDGAYARLIANGAASLSPPHDFLSNLRVAWIADSDGNPIRLIQRRN